MLGRFVFFVALAVAGAVSAQDVEVPAEVIEECNAMVDGYDKMPGCLKGGTIGYHMLEAAARDDLYGDTAREIARACAASNEGYYKQWVCLENAAEKAVEIRGMIGEEQMKDRCYRAVSDPDTYERLMQEAGDLRSRVLGDGYWSGITSYHAFEGCDDDAGHDHEHEHEDDSGGFSPASCRAYAEVETVLETRSESDLRASLQSLKALPEEARLDALTDHGLSPQSVAALRSELDGDAALGAMMLMMGFLRDAHPELFADVLTLQGESTEPMADAMTAGMLDLLLGGIMDSYRTACPRQ